MAKSWISFYNTPILHHSSTPEPQDSGTLGNLDLPFVVESEKEKR